MDPEPVQLPARAVSKYVYCPRLFHLEWVQGHWQDTDETRLGQHVHRATDRRSTRVPEPEDETEPGWQARSVSLPVWMRDVLHLVAAGPVQVSTQAMHALAEQGSAMVWLSTGGWLKAVTTPGAGKHVELRRRQYSASDASALSVARQIVTGTIVNSRTLLRRNAREADPDSLKRLDTAVEQVNHAGTLDTLRGIEGAASRTYFGAFSRALRQDHRVPGPAFENTGRTRRPPRDAVSCLLSYLYALLVKDVTTACYALGFDPYFGLYHQARYGRPPLVLDLVEEFRSLLADSTALTLVNTRQANQTMFQVHPTAVALTRDGRRTVINAYERRLATEVRHPVSRHQLTYRRCIELQARILAAYLLGEIPHYTPMTTR